MLPLPNLRIWLPGAVPILSGRLTLVYLAVMLRWPPPLPAAMILRASALRSSVRRQDRLI